MLRISFFVASLGALTACSSSSTHRKALPADADASVEAGTGAGGATAAADGGFDAGSPKCMEVADGTGAVVTAATDAKTALVVPLQGGTAAVATGTNTYFLGRDDLPITQLDGVDVTASSDTTLGVLAELAPATLHVTSAIGISGINIRTLSPVPTAKGVWVQFLGSGDVNVGGVAADGTAVTDQTDAFVAYVEGTTVSFVHRLGTSNGASTLSADPSGNAWLLFSGDVTVEGTAYTCGAVISKLSTAGKLGGTRCVSTGEILPDALAADDAGGVYVSGYPRGAEQDLGDGKFTIDASAGASVLGRFDASGKVLWHDVTLRGYTREILPLPGGFFSAGNLPQSSDRNGLLELAGVRYLPCQTENHLTRFSDTGKPVYSRAYTDTTVEFLAASSTGDVLYRRQSAYDPLVPGMVLPDAASSNVAFGVVSGSRSGAVLWERNGFFPSSASPLPDGGWLVAGTRQIILDGGFSRFETRVELY